MTPYYEEDGITISAGRFGVWLMSREPDPLLISFDTRTSTRRRDRRYVRRVVKRFLRRRQADE